MAWDPVAQKAAWTVDHVGPWNGGTLATAGNLVFQGTADGRFIAFDARNGKKLWEVPTGTGVVAAPSTFEVDGKQYVSIAVGWGGVYGIAARHTDRAGPGTVYTFALGGTAKPPAFVEYKLNALLQGVPYDKSHYEVGTALYVSNCVFCHGVPGVDRGGNVPNLGYSTAATITNLDKFVLSSRSEPRACPTSRASSRRPRWNRSRPSSRARRTRSAPSRLRTAPASARPAGRAPGGGLEVAAVAFVDDDRAGIDLVRQVVQPRQQRQRARAQRHAVAQRAAR